MDSGVSIAAAFSCCSFGSVPCNGTCADLQLRRKLSELFTGSVSAQKAT